MKDAAKGKFWYVVAWKSNRMGRNMLDAMINDTRLRDLDVRCLYTEKDKHYYYVCQKKRQEKACKKKNVRRDWIEQKIAEAVKQNIMQDEVIQWLVDGYDNFLKLHRKDSLLLATKEELEGVKKTINNVMSAIELGIITPTTKDRPVELEEDRRRLKATAAVERAALVDIPKDKIEFWLESFRDGDVTGKRYQAKLIDSFGQTVYLYDGDIRIAFNYFWKRNNVTVSLNEIGGLGSSDALAECSYKIPHRSATIKT